MRITFLKVRPKDHPFPIFAWLIMLFQGMNPFRRNAFSHMAICYESETGASKVVDVPFTGFRQMSEKEFFKRYHIVGMRQRDYEIERVQFLTWLEQHEHKNYDFFQIFGLALKILRLKKFNSLGKDFVSMICSELLLSFQITFNGLTVIDSDDYDLNMTWDVIA